MLSWLGKTATCFGREFSGARSAIFCGFLRATSRQIAAELTGLHHNSTPALYRRLRLRMTELAREGCPFRGQIEIDERTFGPVHVRVQRGRGGGRKTSVFGILKCDGRVHHQIVINCLKVS